jgi:ParB family chromosome partitioning protein
LRNVHRTLLWRLLQQQRLTLFGLTAEQIAHQLSTSKETVEAGLTARRSRSASQALDSFPQLTMEQAAELTQFEEDEHAYPDLISTLESDPENFEHRMAEWRQDYELRAARDQLTNELRDAGVDVVGPYLPPDTAPLSRLRQSKSDKTLLDDEPAKHASCEGHAAYISTNQRRAQSCRAEIASRTPHGEHAAPTRCGTARTQN